METPKQDNGQVNTHQSKDSPEASETLTPKILSVYKEYLPLFVALFSLLFIGLRLLSISNQNYETADGILQASGTGTGSAADAEMWRSARPTPSPRPRH